MQGFLDDEHKIRRLDNKADVLTICDIIKNLFSSFISSHAKVNTYIDILQAKYLELLKMRT